MNQNLQDVLEMIFLIDDQGKEVRLKSLASLLGFSKSRTNQSVKKLRGMKLVEENKYGPINLTKLGRYQGERIYFSHNVIKSYLIEFLGIDEMIAQKDACLMEHVVSNHTIKKMALKLIEKNVKIKGFDLNKADSYLKNKKSMSDLEIGQSGRILSLDLEPYYKKRLLEMSIIKGETVTLKSIGPLGDPMEFAINDYKVSLRKKEIEKIIVELLKEGDKID